MMNHTMKFDLIAILVLLKGPDDSDFTNGDYKFSKIVIQGFFFFANISRLVRSQLLVFYHIAIWGLLKMINSSNLDCGV